MLSLPPSVRIFVSTAPTDMRKSFDGLAALARHHLGRDPLSGHLFVFFNQRRTLIKVLCWDRNGFTLWAKRLERGTFEKLEGSGGQVELEAAQLGLLLEGLKVSQASRRPGHHHRWAPTQASHSMPAQ